MDIVPRPETRSDLISKVFEQLKELPEGQALSVPCPKDAVRRLRAALSYHAAKLNLTVRSQLGANDTVVLWLETNNPQDLI